MREKPLEFLEWRVHSWNDFLSGWVECPLTWRGRGGGCHHGLGAPHPLGFSSLLYIGGWSSSPLLAHSLPPLGLSSRCSTITSHGLGEALLELFLHHHAVVLEVPVDPLLPLPSWSEGTEVFVKPYVWPSTDAPLVCDARHRGLETVKWSATPTTRLYLVRSSLHRE